MLTSLGQQCRDGPVRLDADGGDTGAIPASSRYVVKAIGNLGRGAGAATDSTHQRIWRDNGVTRTADETALPAAGFALRLDYWATRSVGGRREACRL